MLKHALFACDYNSNNRFKVRAGAVFAFHADLFERHYREH